jgi:E3 ubiquitin-protein ligase RNF14
VAVDVKPVETSTKRVIRLSDISTTQSNSTSTATDSSSNITIKPILPDDRWDRYRRCPSCQYSFCLYCSATWHGPHAPCAFTTASVIVEEYLSYPEGSPERLKMEIRRGKRNIEKMIAKWQEDEENKKWMEEKTMPCSGCGVRVERR